MGPRREGRIFEQNLLHQLRETGLLGLEDTPYLRIVGDDPRTHLFMLSAVERRPYPFREVRTRGDVPDVMQERRRRHRPLVGRDLFGVVRPQVAHEHQSEIGDAERVAEPAVFGEHIDRPRVTGLADISQPLDPARIDKGEYEPVGRLSRVKEQCAVRDIGEAFCRWALEHPMWNGRLIHA